jgi:hypothetical protein
MRRTSTRWDVLNDQVGVLTTRWYNNDRTFTNPLREDHQVVTPSKRIVRQPETGSLSIEDARLDMLRPDPALLDEYVTREMANGQTDVEYLLDCWERRENVLLVGDTQGGKTMLVRVMAILAGQAMGHSKPLPVFTLSASSGITDFDLFGQPTSYTDPVSGVDSIVWLPGVVDMAARVGGLLYLDEVNMMPERVTSSLHPITDWRRTFTNRAKAVKVPGDGFMPETVKLHPDLWIVGTMNPNYRGAGTLNEAFSNRFRHLTWNYNPDVERTLVPNEGVRLLGDALRTARSTGHLRTPVGTAALMRLANDVVTTGVDMAIYCLLSMFTQDEVPVVEEIIESRSFRSLIVSMPQGVPTGWPTGADSNSPF